MQLSVNCVVIKYWFYKMSCCSLNSPYQGQTPVYSGEAALLPHLNMRETNMAGRTKALNSSQN